MKTALENFLIHLQVEKRCSPSTVSAYRLDLDRSLLPYLSTRGKSHFNEITSQDILSYIEYLSFFRDNNEASRARKLSSAKAFFEYLVACGQIYKNPAAHVRTPRYDERKPPVLSDGECCQLLRTVGKQARWNVKERDTAIIVILLNTGIKVSELVALDIEDADTAGARLAVPGPDNSRRHLYLAPETVEVMEGYLAVRPAQFCRKLFVRASGAPLDRVSVYRIVRRYLSLAGISKDKQGPNLLRQTCFTRLHNAGVDPYIIKALAGHKSIAATMRYGHAGSEYPPENGKKFIPPVISLSRL